MKQWFHTKDVPGKPEAIQVICRYGNLNEHEICIVDTNGAGDRGYSEWIAKVIIEALTEEQDAYLGEELETYETIS